MQKKLTITIDEKVYKALHKKIGRGRISGFIETLLRPHLLNKEIENGYRMMALDKEREDEALDWSEEMIGDVVDA